MPACRGRFASPASFNERPAALREKLSGILGGRGRPLINYSAFKALPDGRPPAKPSSIFEVVNFSNSHAWPRTTCSNLLWSFSKVVDNVRFCLFLNWDRAAVSTLFEPRPPRKEVPFIVSLSVCLDRSERRDREEESGWVAVSVLRIADGRTMAALLCASEIQSAAASPPQPPKPTAAARILPKGTEEKTR